MLLVLRTIVTPPPSTRFSSAVTLSRQPTILLTIADRSFRHASLESTAWFIPSASPVMSRLTSSFTCQLISVIHHSHHPLVFQSLTPGSKHTFSTNPSHSHAPELLSRSWDRTGADLSCFSNYFSSLFSSILSASLYISKRGAYWDRLYRDVVGRWSLVGWLVVGCHARALWPNGAS